MKILENFFKTANLTFKRYKLLEPFFPVMQATEAFFLGVRENPVSPPFIRDYLDLKRYMFFVVIALAPVTFAGLYFFGPRVLLIIAVSYVAGGLVEVIFAIIRKHEINEGFLVTGLLFPLTLPSTVPLWMVAAGAISGVAIGKELFGGTGHNIFNPALTARCFVYLSYPVAVTSGWIKPGNNLLNYLDSSSVDSMTSATPLALYKDGVMTDLTPLFYGSVPGSIGETSALLILVGGIFLVLTGIANYRSTLGMIAGGAITSAAFHYTGFSQFAPPLFTILSGGFLFGAVFMITDPVSSPSFNITKWIYGVLTGALVVVIRSLSGYPGGVMFSILIMNMFSPLIDQIFLTLKYPVLRSSLK